MKEKDRMPGFRKGWGPRTVIEGTRRSTDAPNRFHSFEVALILVPFVGVLFISCPFRKAPHLSDERPSGHFCSGKANTICLMRNNGEFKLLAPFSFLLFGEALPVSY